MAALSVIILACNDEKWIRTAVDSVLRQTLHDIEIIIVDDGSTDSTPAILADYAARDERVKIVTNESNRGMFYSRWNGVRHAAGDYIMFLDSDDTLVPNACEVLSGIVDKEDYDVFMFGSVCVAYNNSVKENEIRKTNDFLRPPVGPFPKGQGAMLEYVAGGRMGFSVWNKVFRRSILLKVYTGYDGERVQMAEDLLLTTMALAYASSFGATPQVLHHYTYGSGVSTVFKITRKKIESFAVEAQVYPLMKKWMPATGLKEYVYRNVLKMVEERTTVDVLWALFYRTEKSDAAFFIEQVLQYWSLEELGENLVDYIFRRKLISTLDALDRLQGCFPVNDGREIRTVGMYYRRFYNGGVERVLSLLTPILMRAGYRVVLITDEGPTDDDYELAEGARHVRLDAPGSDPNKRIKKWHEILKKEKIDALIYHLWVDENLLQDSVSVKSAGIPLLLHVHGSVSYIYRFLPNSVGSWLNQRLIYALFDTVVTLSEPDLFWCRALGMQAVQVNNPLTYPLEENYPEFTKEKRILWVGRLSGEKQYKDAFEIAELVHKSVPDATLHLVGKTETPEEYRQITDYIIEHDMSDYVLFDGYHEDVREDYRKAAVYLCTSEFEGFSMSLQEAKVFGLPAVSYELPNLTLLRGEDTGSFCVEQGNKKAAADRIVELLSDDELRKAEGIKARKNVEKLYTEDPADVWKRIIEETCEERVEPTPLIEQSPEYVAVRMATDNAAFGVNGITGYFWPNQAEVEQNRNEVARLSGEIAALVESNKYFEDTIHEIQHSTSFRLGMLLTWPLRKLKDWILRLRK